MRKIISFFALLATLQAVAQDTTMNNLTKGMDTTVIVGKKPVKIFNSEKTINANTTEVVPKGKMEFKVSHNFSDIGGKAGGIDNFFGLDVSTDIRIGFDIGLTDRLNLSMARSKGDVQRLRTDTSGAPHPQDLAGKLYEVALKYQLLRQFENDPGHPIAISIFAQTAISTQIPLKDPITHNVVPNRPGSFENLGDRMSQVVQLIIAKKIGKASVQINPTLVHYNYVPTYDQATTFALGGAVRIPLSNTFTLIVDYFHPFQSDSKKNYYKDSANIRFRDPLGVGLEITTAGHIFHLNFTNTTGLLENQFIPYNTSSWGKGQFRWAFSISRIFVLWRERGK